MVQTFSVSEDLQFFCDNIVVVVSVSNICNLIDSSCLILGLFSVVILCISPCLNWTPGLNCLSACLGLSFLRLLISCGSQHRIKLSFVSSVEIAALDLLAGVFSMNCNFNGVFSLAVSALAFLLMRGARSADIDLLTCGDSDLTFVDSQLSPEMKRGLAPTFLLEDITEEQKGFCCFTDEQLLGCKTIQKEMLIHPFFLLSHKMNRC